MGFKADEIYGQIESKKEESLKEFYKDSYLGVVKSYCSDWGQSTSSNDIHAILIGDFETKLGATAYTKAFAQNIKDIHGGKGAGTLADYKYFMHITPEITPYIHNGPESHELKLSLTSYAANTIASTPAFELINAHAIAAKTAEEIEQRSHQMLHYLKGSISKIEDNHQIFINGFTTEEEAKKYAKSFEDGIINFNNKTNLSKKIGHDQIMPGVYRSYTLNDSNLDEKKYPFIVRADLSKNAVDLLKSIPEKELRAIHLDAMESNVSMAKTTFSKSK